MDGVMDNGCQSFIYGNHRVFASRPFYDPTIPSLYTVNISATTNLVFLFDYSYRSHNANVSILGLYVLLPLMKFVSPAPTDNAGRQKSHQQDESGDNESYGKSA